VRQIRLGCKVDVSGLKGALEQLVCSRLEAHLVSREPGNAESAIHFLRLAERLGIGPWLMAFAKCVLAASEEFKMAQRASVCFMSWRTDYGSARVWWTSTNTPNSHESLSAVVTWPSANRDIRSVDLHANPTKASIVI
jgi:hypothetical protein